MRSGSVLDPQGGVLAKMLPFFRLGVGGPVGSGDQYVSWIQLEDLADLYIYAMDNDDVSGPINGTSPHPVTNRELAQSLGHALHRPAVIPVPGFALRTRYGELATVLTKGQRVLPRRAQELGFQFAYPDLDPALLELARIAR